MKLETTDDGGFVVTFKAWTRFWRAVESGEKTAEARLLNGQEIQELEDADLSRLAKAGQGAAPPAIMRLVDTDTHEALERELSWFDEVGRVLGSSIVLFCWKAAP